MNHLGKGTSPTENLIFDLKMIPLLRKEHDISSQTILIFGFPGTYLISTHDLHPKLSTGHLGGSVDGGDFLGENRGANGEFQGAESQDQPVP